MLYSPEFVCRRPLAVASNPSSSRTWEWDRRLSGRTAEFLHRYCTQSHIVPETRKLAQQSYIASSRKSSDWMSFTATVEFPRTPASSGLHIITRASVFITGQCPAVGSIPHRPVGDTGPLEHLPAAPVPPHQPSAVQASERHAAPERGSPSPAPSHSAAPGNVRCSPEQYAVNTASSIAAAAHINADIGQFAFILGTIHPVRPSQIHPYSRAHNIASSESKYRTARISILFNIAHTSA